MSEDWYDRLGRNPRLQPAHLRMNNGSEKLLALLAERRVTERLPAAELARRQGAVLYDLARHAAAHSPHFARRLAADGLTPATLAEPGGLAKLAPLTRRQLVNA